MPTLTARVKDALSTADEIGVDPVRFFLELLAHRALFDCDVRWIAAVFVGADGTKSAGPPSPPADRRREHRGSANFVVAAAVIDP
jgi:hypothetical protein